ncbi:Helix-turn-helix domain-containing protein [Halorubrum aquaticum]|uniref:Helix-turn-helix domain-containing protein n=1 Tax=Halorubrum aquaticum TaxID=387340 RepID=A0A1I2ZM90_9EURY|nr:winged helix-turn-helix domain-containing protein [Halorubrum aquaticum]SFH38201.1 Helix-turn-helix domain-containing protein [Halorubrum aquaticum]
MASVFPHQPTVEHTPRERTDVVVDRDQQTDVLSVVSSEAAQEILSALREEPSTASDLAETVDRSLQNVSYHLRRLRGADLVTPVETWYSEKGTEMTVYALTAERIVVRFDDRGDDPGDEGDEDDGVNGNEGVNGDDESDGDGDDRRTPAERARCR